MAKRKRLVVFIDEAGPVFPVDLDRNGRMPVVSQTFDLQRHVNLHVVLGCQEISWMMRTVLAVSLKAAFRQPSGIDAAVVATAMALPKREQAMLSVLPDRVCVLATGRQPPIPVEVADTPIETIPESVLQEFLRKKAAFSLRIVGGSKNGVEPLTDVEGHRDGEKPPLAKDASNVLAFLANEPFLGREQLFERIGLPQSRIKVALEDLRQTGLITHFKQQVERTGRPRSIEYPSIRGWKYLGQDASKKRLHSLLQEMDRNTVASSGLRAQIEIRNGDVVHDVVGRDRHGRVVAVSEIALSVHARLLRQIYAAVDVGARRVRLVCLDGPDVKELQRLLDRLPADVAKLVEICPIRELPAQKLRVSAGGEPPFVGGEHA